MKPSIRLAPALALAVVLLNPGLGAADEAKSQAPTNDPSVERAAPPPVDQGMLDRLQKAQPMKPPKVKGDVSAFRRSPLRPRANGFGTVTKKLGGPDEPAAEPPSEPVQNSLKKQGTLPKPLRKGKPTFKGAVEPVAAASGRVERKVFGTDDRIRVQYNREVPFRNIGLLMMKFPGMEGDTTCSGTIIDKRHVLTAAHCLYDVESGQFASEVRFFPGIDTPDNIPFGAYDATYITVLSGYVDTPTNVYDFDHVLYDMGVVELSQPAGNRLGWLPYGYNDNLPPFVANIVGYPGDMPFATMWRVSCDVDPVEGYPQLFYQFCDTYPGSSGSSMYDFNQSTQDRVIYGVNVAESESSNVGVRITGPYFAWLQQVTGH